MIRDFGAPAFFVVSQPPLARKVTVVSRTSATIFNTSQLRLIIPAISYFAIMIMLLILPLEIRNIIWSYACDWNEAVIARRRYGSGKRRPQTQIDVQGSTLNDAHPRTTPTVLLLSRQITEEALIVLRKRPLLLPESPLPQIVHHDYKKQPLYRYITWETMVQVPVIQFEMNLRATFQSTKIYFLEWTKFFCCFALLQTRHNHKAHKSLSTHFQFMVQGFEVMFNYYALSTRPRSRTFSVPFSRPNKMTLPEALGKCLANSNRVTFLMSSESEQSGWGLSLLPHLDLDHAHFNALFTDQPHPAVKAYLEIPEHLSL